MLGRYRTLTVFVLIILAFFVFKSQDSVSAEEPVPYEVGIRDPEVGPEYFTNAFRAAYYRNSVSGQPLGLVHEWGGVLVQDFDWATIIYNETTGSAFYVYGPHISALVDQVPNGPGGWIGLPISDVEPAAPADYQDDYFDFSGQPIVYFQNGFIGINAATSQAEAHRHFPTVDATVTISPMLIGSDYKAQLDFQFSYDTYGGANGITQIGVDTAILSWEESGNGPTTWNTSFPQEVPLGTDVSFVMQVRRFMFIGGDELTGYSPCDHVSSGGDLHEFTIPTITDTVTTLSFPYTCSGNSGGGGGGGDTIKPTISEPNVWQNGAGWAVIEVPVSDNVRVDWVKIYLNGQAYHMTLWEGNTQSGTYSVVVPLKLGRNEYYIEASDLAGNIATYPTDGSTLEIWATQDADYGKRPDMGYSDDPVNTLLGNFVYNYIDVEVPALGPDVVIERWYNHQSRYNGLLGIGWTFTYDMRLEVVENLLLSGARLRYADGHTVNFARDSAGEMVSTDTPHDILTQEGSDYLLTVKDGTQYRFNSEGYLMSVRDDDGNSILLAYTGEGLTTITDASGRVLSFTYNGEGDITGIHVPDYGMLTYDYQDGRLTAATDTEGNVSHYSYDDTGCILSITSPQGNPFLNTQTCDENGRVTHQLGGTGYVNEFTYDDQSLTTTITDPYGNITTHVYDEDYHLVENRDALGYAIFYTYSEDHLPLTITDKNGQTTTFTYDERGNVLTMTDPLGYITSQTYDENDNVLSRTDALGNTFAYEYDSENHLTHSIAPDGAIAERVYDENGLLIRTINELGHVSETTYNQQGLPVSVTDALGNVSTMVYDSAGHLLSQTDASGNTASYQYNSRDLVEIVTDPEGYTTSYTYDNDRNLIGETNQDGYSKTYTYDENGRLIAESDWSGNTTTYTYDDLGRKVAETDPLGYTTSYEYDAVSNLMAMTDKRGATTTYTYDGNGNRLTETDALGHVTSYAYDPLNRLIETSYPCGCASRVEQVEYDALGRVIARTDANGNVTQFEYDALGRETKRIDALGYETVNVYNLAGNLIVERDALGYETHYAYDALNRVVEVTNRLGYSATKTYDESGRLIATTDERGNTTEFVYDGNSRLLERIDPFGHVTSYTYDGRGNRLTLTNGLGYVTSYQYDANGNLIGETSPRGYTTTYLYDARNQRLAVIDALGHTTSYSYDPAGAPLIETDALGYTRQTTYDLLGRAATATNRNGHSTTLVYDPAGNLSQVIDALGGETSYTYDPNNNRLTETNALGFTTTYLYDALNRQVAVIDALGGVSTRSYDALGRLIEVVDANGHLTTYAYDAEGQRVATTDALGHTSEAHYDPAGNLIMEVDRNGNVTLHAFDALNREVMLTNGLGYSATTTYDAVGNPIERVNFRGYATQHSYDPNNNLVNTIDAMDGVTTLVYDPLDRLVSETNARGYTTTYSYDAVHNRLTITLPEGQTDTYTYDGEGNKVTFTNARGYTTVYGYDALNRLVTETDPLSHVIMTEYDAISQVTRVIDANGNANSYLYDPLGRLVAVVDALGYVTSYSYDAVGNRLAKMDANGHIHAFTYDAVNRLVSEFNPIGSTWLYSYDPEGNLIQSLDANGQVLLYDFDAVHQLMAIHHADPAEDVAYGYNENGNLVWIADPVGVTVLTYDPLDREVSKSDVYGRTTAQGYDDVGNRTSLTYPDGNQVNYVYNGNDWLITMVDPATGQTSYSYEDDGQVRTIDYPNDTWTYNFYDAAGRLVRLDNTTGIRQRNIVTSYAYTLDAVGNRLRIVEKYTQGRVYTNVKTYQYNGRYELLRAVEVYQRRPVSVITTLYTYDPAGNRLSMTTNRDTGPGPNPPMMTTNYSYDAADRMLTAGDITFAYDANGNRLTKITPETPPAQDRLEEYIYDDQNRLVTYMRTRLQGGGLAEQTVYNIYDGLGRRVNKGLQNANGLIKWTQYTLDGLSYDQLVEYPQVGQPVVTELYRGVDNQLVSMEEIQGGGDGKQYWFSPDGLESVAAITKQNGQSTHEFFYDPYGEVIDGNGHWEDSSAWTDPHNHYLLSGKEWDEESRLYYFGARFYDAEAGVWLTSDPYRGEVAVPRTLHSYLHLGHNAPGQADNANSPMSLHRYLYGQNNPINRVDPLGFFNWNTGHVESGDTLWQIAQDAGLTVGQILSWNPQIEHPDKIIVDMYIWLPSGALEAGKLAEAIRHNAGADEPVWGKNPAKDVDDFEWGNDITDDFLEKLRTSAQEMENYESSFRELMTGCAANGLPRELVMDKIQEKFTSVENVRSLLPEHVQCELTENPDKFLFFYERVRADGVWDYKVHDYAKYRYSGVRINGELYAFDHPGNFAFGYAGSAGRFSEDVLKMMAGLAQRQAGTSKDEWTWETSYYDDPRDQKAISAGIALYNSYGRDINAEKLGKAFESLKE
jgi:RHS repeat-associated protein